MSNVRQRHSMRTSFVIQIFIFTLLILISSAMFFANAWASGVLIVLAAAMSHPATKLSQVRYRWTIIGALLFAAIWFQPNEVGRSQKNAESRYSTTPLPNPAVKRDWPNSYVFTSNSDFNPSGSGHHLERPAPYFQR